MRLLIDVEGGRVQNIHLDSTEGDLEIWVSDRDNQKKGEEGLIPMDWINQTRWGFDVLLEMSRSEDQYNAAQDIGD
mgnify:CR=1 FL=1